jgi:hypothetical protein
MRIEGCVFHEALDLMMLSSTDENSFDLDSGDKVHYHRACLTEKM